MSYNGSGTFVVNSSGQPVVTGTVISSTAFNALTADLATGLTTAITKDGQTTTTARVPFAQGVSSTLVTDATSATTGSIITAGGISMQKALWVGTTSRHVGAATFDAAITYGGVTLTNAVTGTGSMVLSASPTLTGTAAHAAGTFSGDLTVGGTSGNGSTPSGGIGLGVAAISGTPLNIASTANSTQTAQFYNNSGSTAASAQWRLVNNAASQGIVRLYGGSFTTSGVDRQDGMLVSASGAGGLTVGTSASQPIYFAVANAEVARFGTDGSFLVGTTTTGGWTTAAKIEGQTATGYGVSGYCTGSGTGVLSRVDTTGGVLLSFYYGASTRISYWSTNGSTSTFNNPSDIRLKTVAETQFDYSGPIKAMQMVDFNWTETGAADFGGLAQQAYEAFADTPIRDVLVSKPKNPEDKWFVAPDYYGRLALWGVKDLYAEVEALKASMADLTTRLAALENK